MRIRCASSTRPVASVWPVPAARRRRPVVVVLAMAGMLTVGGCVGPTPTYSAYQGKAQQTAQAMIGIVASARLTAESLLRGDVTYAFADQTISRAEQNASSVRLAFDSRQPPDSRSDRLRGQVDAPLNDAVTALTDLRIAVRRADTDGIRAAVTALDGPLRAFQQLAGRLR